MAENSNGISISENDLFNEFSKLIERSKNGVVFQVNSAVTILFCHVIYTYIIECICYFRWKMQLVKALK